MRHNGTLDYLLPDGKTQVSVVYENDKPVAIDTILISTQHTAEVAGHPLHTGFSDDSDSAV